MFYEIRNTLIDIILNCYSYLPEEKINKYTKFYIKLENKILKSYLGKYNPKDRSIHLYNIKTESNVSCIVTLIHELSHHIDCMNRHTSAHDEKFYKIHLELLRSAFDMNIIDYKEFMCHSSSAGNIRKLKRLVEKMNYLSTAKPVKYKEDYIWIIVTSYDRDENANLKKSGFTFNPYIKKWCQRCLKNDKEKICSQFVNNEITYISGATLIFCLDQDTTELNMNIHKSKEYQKKDNVCPVCGKPLIIKKGKYGDFEACTGYPACNYTHSLKSSKNSKKSTKEQINKQCPVCGRNLVIKKGKYGEFEACSGYPECKYTKKINSNSTEDICPVCGKILVIRNGKYGKFKACSGYPNCHYIEKKKG